MSISKKNIFKELERQGFIVKPFKKKRGKASLKALDKKENKDKKRPAVKRYFWPVFVLIILAGLATGLYILNLYHSLPTPEAFNQRLVSQTTKIYDRAGEVLLYEIHGDEKRTVIPLNEIPQYTQEAVIAVEDADFYNHPAFDWRAIVRAAAKNILQGKISQGGSTITQQLAKNAFLTPQKTIIRKIKDILLAVKLEKRYPKDQILEFYLNQISFGSNLYGLEAASQAFFAKKAQDLTIAQSAILAAIIQLPTYYSPYGSHRDELFARQEFILNKMKDLGYLDKQQLESALSEKIEFQPKAANIKAPHFVMFIREYLENKYGANIVETAGLKVITTLDWKMQQIAEKAVLDGSLRNEELYGGKNAALIAEDPKTGQILAMVGARDYFDTANDGNFNVITGHRQPGSSFKPFAYLACFEKGYLPEAVVFDLKTDFNATGIASMKYEPENFDHIFRGPVDLRHALAQSINVPAVKVLYLAGLSNTISLAKKLGITTLNETGDYGLSLVLGGGDVRPLDMAKAYSVFASDGIKREQSAVLKVEDNGGNVLEEFQKSGEKVFDSKYIRLLNDILSDNEARVGLFRRDNQLVIPGYQVAAKTGTTQDYRDAWVFGYTPFLTAGVWAGNNDFSPMHQGGGSILAAVPIWNDFMKQVLPGYQPETFPKPDQIELPADKPMLNGQYLAYYRVENQLYPQIHSILYWLDRKSDPQFENWEKPITSWIKENFSNSPEFNQEIPAGYGQIVNSENELDLEIISPQSGAFLTPGKNIKITLNVFSPEKAKYIKIYFNNSLISQISAPFGNQISLDYLPPALDSQNEIKAILEDGLGNKTESKVIVYH